MDEPQSIGDTLKTNCRKYVQDVITPIRVMLTTATIYVFLFALGQIASAVLNWLFRDVRSRMAYLDYALDGFQVATVLAATGFGLWDTVSSLLTIRRVALKLGKEVGL